MSNIYNYDLFLSCAREDKYFAQVLSHKLRELDFVTWFEATAIENERSIEEIHEALENSAVCVLLLGASGSLPWYDDSIWSAICSRLDRTYGTFRVITAFLPGANAESAGMLTGLIRKQHISYQQHWAAVRFKEGLDEEDVMQDLVLRIRGVDPNDHSDWLEGSFRNSVRLRAQNALNVDWHRLFFDISSERLNTFDQEYDIALDLKCHRDSLNLFESNLEEESTLSTHPQGKYWIDQKDLTHWPHNHKVTPPIYTLMSNYGSTMAAGVLLMLAVALGYFLKDRPDSLNNNNEVIAGSGINLEVAQNTGSRQNNFAEANTNSNSSRGSRRRKANTTRTSKRISVSSSLTPRADLEESFAHPEIPNEWKSQAKAKLARMKRIYVEARNNVDFDQDSNSRVLEKFIQVLKGNGIEVLTKKEDRDRAHGIAELQFGPKEIKSGTVLVELRDNKDQNIMSWAASTKCKTPERKVMPVGVCEASEQLGGKLVSAIRAAQSGVDKHIPQG